MADREGAGTIRNRLVEDCLEILNCAICQQHFHDARLLGCSHSFCLKCLKKYQEGSTRAKECPVCKKKSVPPVDKVDNLVKNNFATDLVDLLTKHKVHVETNEFDDFETGSNHSSSSSGSLSGALGGLLQLQERLPQLQEMMLNRLLNDATNNNNSNTNETEEDEDERVSHGGVTCDKCGTNVRGDCYKCGLCDDYDLCSECFLSVCDTHDDSHPFVKLKRQRDNHRKEPFLDLLNVKRLNMLMTSSNLHKGVICDQCKVTPIRGYRYKCGLCVDYDLCETCEENSATMHDPNHTFIVIQRSTTFNCEIPLQKWSFYDT